MKIRTRRFAYFDTSVLVKKYLREPGSDKARQLGRRLVAVTSEIAVLEMTSALRRNLASAVIDEESHRAIRNRLERDRAKLQLVEIRSNILEHAVGSSSVASTPRAHAE